VSARRPGALRRPHRGCYRRRRWPLQPPLTVPPSHSRRVSAEGRINFADRRYQIGGWLAGETVQVACRDGLLEVSHRGVLVASLARREKPPVTGVPPLAARPTRLPVAGRSVLRKVGSSGHISFAGLAYRVGNAYRGQQVEVRLVGDRVEIAKDGELLKSWPARHDRFKEHGAFANPGGRPERINASSCSSLFAVTEVPRPTCNTGGET